MKIEMKSKEDEIVTLNYNGLVIDSEGEKWLFIDRAMIFIDEIGLLTLHATGENAEEAFNDFGPFTKFNGSVTLEND